LMKSYKYKLVSYKILRFGDNVITASVF
jgi:hypothetical protein